ncbi:MAG: hypothetical protein EA339_08400 [Rhodobacteraceae bacterium]|nr:MAG: hypothetical protein EA339_08400 [Paracoccaceae bacterium]
MKRLSASVIGVLMAGGVWADTSPFDGRYKLNPDVPGCVVGEGDVANAAFEIRNGRFISIETECRLANPTNIRDMGAMLYDLTCSSEGEEWSDRILLMMKDDGSLLRVVDGMAFTNPPCE